MSVPHISILTIFPQWVESVLQGAILRRAQLKGRVELEAKDLRTYALDAHRSVDNTPFGGKQGMLFRVDVLERALESELQAVGGDRKKLKVFYTSPRGLLWEQGGAEKTAQWLMSHPSTTSSEETNPQGARLLVVCGRYEGVDERFVERWVDLELSLGDFILSGGELAALAVVDSIVRLVPGVLGDELSAREDSFSNGLLEYPQYTKPRSFEGSEVPEELYSGHHKNIEQWQLRQSLLWTFAYRPDLIELHSGEGLPAWAQELLKLLKRRL